MSENKKVLVTDFVNKCRTLTNEKLKNDYIASIMKRSYCPILEKKSVLDLMLEKSLTGEENKTIDLFVNKLNFYAAIILLYTYIIPDKDEKGVPKSYEMYDLLMEHNLMNSILEHIGEREIGELTSINGLLLDNWYANNTSTKAYVNEVVNTASRRFGIAGDLILEKLTEVLDDEVKMNKVTSVLDKMIKKIK